MTDICNFGNDFQYKKKKVKFNSFQKFPWFLFSSIFIQKPLLDNKKNNIFPREIRNVKPESTMLDFVQIYREFLTSALGDVKTP